MIGMEKDRLEQKLEELKKDYAKTKYNKATNKYLSILRAKMAKIRRTMAEHKNRKGTGFSVRKSGDATIALVGFPNAGKSSLLKALTGVESKVADYAFTTLDVIPGMLDYNGARLQVLDLPGLIEGAHMGRGGGTMIASVLRVVDLLLFVVDVKHPEHLYILLDELDSLGIKVNVPRPRITLEEEKTGGIVIESNRKSIPSPQEITKVLNEFGIYNAKLMFWQNADIDTLIDFISSNNVYIRCIVALNKIDDYADYARVRDEIEKKAKMEVVPISVLQKANIDLLKECVFRNLGIKRIFLKEKGEEPDFKKPLVLRTEDTVIQLAKKLHTDIADNLRYALITGKSARFKNQKVGPDHVVADGDIVTLVYDKT